MWSFPRKLDEQHSKVKAVLTEYASWKSLSSREALEQYSTMQSRLSSIPSMCSGLDMPTHCQLCPKMSFEMSGLSDGLSFGHLGKITVEEDDGRRGAAVSSLPGNGGARDSIDPPGNMPPNIGNMPPNKKRKTIQPSSLN